MVCRIFLISDKNWESALENKSENNIYKIIGSQEEFNDIMEWFIEERIMNMHFYNQEEIMQVIFLSDEDALAFKLRWL